MKDSITWHQLNESTSENIDQFTIVNYDTEEEIKNLANQLYDFCVVAYSNVEGGYLTARNAKDIEKKVKYASVVWKDNNIIACLLYETRLGGKKATSGGAIPGNEESKNALQAIVRRDIKNFKCYYWTEVSGAMEHYFKKHGGFPVPNIYAPSLLKKFNLTLDEDKYHYIRNIGLPNDDGEVKTDKKCIFGFQSEELIKELMEKFEDYASFRDYVISDDKVPSKQQSESLGGGRYMFIENGCPKIVDDAIGYINYIEELVYENNTNLTCMTPDMYSMLRKAIEILTNSVSTIPEKFREQIMDNVEMGRNLLDDTFPVQIHSIIDD